MADYYSPWSETADSFDRLGGAVGNVLVNLARNKAGMAQAQYDYKLKNQQLQMERELNRERGALFKAQQALQNAETLKTQKEQEKLQAGLDLSKQFGTDIEGLIKAQQGQVFDPAMLARSVGTAGQLAAMGQDKIPLNLAQLSQMNDPRARMLMATDTRVPTEIGVNQIPVDPLTGALQQSGILATPPGYTITDRMTGQQQQTTPLPHSNVGGISGMVSAILKNYSDIAEQRNAFVNAKEPVPPELEAEYQSLKKDALSARSYGVGLMTKEQQTPQTGSSKLRKEDLVAGQIYDTPKGKMKWTGTGFIPAQ